MVIFGAKGETEGIVIAEDTFPAVKLFIVTAGLVIVTRPVEA